MSPFYILLGFIPSAILFFLGRYIGNTGYVDVLKNYDEKKSYDKDAYAAYIKKLMVGSGLAIAVTCTIAFVVAWLVDFDVFSVALILFIIINLQYVIRLKLSHRKFEIK